MNIICITNEPEYFPPGLRARGCTVYDEHLDTCLDPERCWGCVPQLAVHGFLCRSCWEKTEDALSRVSEMILHLRATDNGGTAPGERVSSSRVWKIPVPASWLMADDLLVALGGRHIPSTAGLSAVARQVEDALGNWKHPGYVVATQSGAAAAVTLYRTMQTALARWPDTEKKRTMPAPMKCRKCLAHSLTRMSPLDYLGDVVVKCDVCGETYDWWQFLDDAAVLVTAIETARKRKAKKTKEIAS